MREYEKALSGLFQGRDFDENFVCFPKYEINAGYVLKVRLSLILIVYL